MVFITNIDLNNTAPALLSILPSASVILSPALQKASMVPSLEGVLPDAGVST